MQPQLLLFYQSTEDMDLEHLKWRYAVKRYDSTEKISEEQKQYVRESIRLTPTSLGLQPFKVFEIRSSEIKTKLKEACFNQLQIIEADMVLVFASYTKISEDHINFHIQNTANIRNQAISSLEPFKKGIQSFVSKLSEDALKNWSSKQTYIALGIAMSECARMGIDSTPMEGFNQDQVNNLLDLNEKDLETSVILAVGRRNEQEDFLARQPKVRKSLDQLFEEV